MKSMKVNDKLMKIFGEKKDTVACVVDVFTLFFLSFLIVDDFLSNANENCENCWKTREIHLKPDPKN